ncbi:MAG: MFS transporter [Actinobacteria bacterium]|nr:MAG: MFS transporter [Actinomycetota bacterium]
MSSPHDDAAPAKSTRFFATWNSGELTLLIGAVALITFSAFEAVATTTIMPNVVADLRAESWFSVASGAAFTAQLIAVVIAGPMSDWRGPRPVLLSGVGAFAVGLLACAWAPHITVFIVGRLIQGLGAGLTIVPLYVLIGALAEKKHHPTFFAAFSLAWVFPSLFGPALAGWVTLRFGWRPLFGVVPFAALVALIPLLILLSAMPPRSDTPAPQLRFLTSMAVLAGSGVFFVQLAGALTGWKLVVLSLLGVALCVAVLPRLLPPGLFTFAPGIPALIATRGLNLAALTGAVAFLPLVLQRVHGWDAAQASLAVTLSSVGWSVGATVQARVSRPVTRFRLPFIGATLSAACLVVVSFLILPSFPIWVALVASAFMGGGTGLLHSTASVIALDMTDVREHGKVSSWLQIADTAASAMQLAVTSIVLGLWILLPGMSGTPNAYIPASVLIVFSAILAVFSARNVQVPPQE